MDARYPNHVGRHAGPVGLKRVKQCQLRGKTWQPDHLLFPLFCSCWVWSQIDGPHQRRDDFLAETSHEEESKQDHTRIINEAREGKSIVRHALRRKPPLGFRPSG